MKKIIAMLLSLVLLLGCAAGSGEEAAEKYNFGTVRVNGEFTLKGTVPEGYRVVPFMQNDEALLCSMVTEDPAKPQMVLSVAYDETYAGVVRINDLDDEALMILEKTFTDTDPYANITYDETAHGTRLLVCRTVADSYDYLSIFSIYAGYFIEFVMTPGKQAPEQKLTEDEIAMGNAFLSDLDFIAGAEEEALKIEGKTFDVSITGFDAAAKTVDLTLLVPYTLLEWDVISVKEGDTIRIGTEDVLIETLAYEGYDAIINDEYFLRKNEDGLYTAVTYNDYPIMKEAAQLTLTVPDGMVYLEGVDPEAGSPLEENREMTAEDFFAALAAEEKDGIGFDQLNVNATFDENGELKQIHRYYVPWQ